MRNQSGLFRLAAALAITGQMLLSPALAQPAPPPPMPQSAPQQPSSGDPPARVGRLARVNGTVSFHAPDASGWSPARVNYPVTAGEAFSTDANAQAEIEVAASRIVLAPATELDIAVLNDTTLQAVQPQGEIYLHLAPATPDETYAVQTPRGMVTLGVPGRYAVVAGDTQSPTTVTVVEGAAQVTGPDLSLQVGPAQMATIGGTDSFTGSVGPAQRDAFLDAMLTREQPPQPSAVAPPPMVAAMPGGEDLSGYGSWDNTPEYGAVWYPQVAPDWVPYSDGSWSYVAPWGWTWVDSAPWGFAPFHYGRWSRFGGRWGWIPGEQGRPVYAPALVTFFGAGAVAGVGVGAALGAGRVGWLPLGPREQYRPWYHASDSYVRNVNGGRAPNAAATSMNGFANRNAATVVPVNAFTMPRQVRPIAQRAQPAELATARPMLGQPPLRPIAAAPGAIPTPGLTTLRPAQPGLAGRPMPAGVATGAVGNAPPVPPLHSQAAGSVRPFPAQPALVVPGNRPMQATPGGIPAVVHAPAAPSLGGPAPQFHTGPPPPAVVNPSMPASAAIHPVAPHAPITQPIQPAAARPTAPPPFVHTPPPAPAPVFHAAPPPQVHAPPPPAPVFHAAPPPQVHAPPPPAPVFHAAPPPQVHAPPPPPPPQAIHAAPQVVHAAPPPPPAHPSQERNKRPGEP